MADDMTFEFVETTKAPSYTPSRIPAELGRTGLVESGGQIQEEFLTQLSGTNAVRVYKEMRDNDPVIGAVMMAILNLVRQSKFTIQPYSDKPRHQRDAEFVEECLEDMDRPFDELISDIMSMIVFGWSFFEIVYKVRNGNVLDQINGSRYNDKRVGWRKFGIRSQDSLDSWDFDNNGNLTALIQRPAPDFIPRRIPIDRGILFRTSVWKDNPEGRSILRNAYRQWYFKKRMEEVEGIGVERDLNGLPVAYVPPKVLSSSASSDELQMKAAVERMVANIRNDSQAGIVLPAMYDEMGNQLVKLELLTTLGRRSFDTNAIITRMNRAIATSMLADFVVIGQENVGSFALASSKTKVFSIAIGSYMDVICDQFNRVAIPQLLKMNGIVRPDMPRMIHGDVETVDLEELARYINALSGVGLDLTGETVREHLASQAGLPPKGLGVAPELRGVGQGANGRENIVQDGIAPDSEDDDASEEMSS